MQSSSGKPPLPTGLSRQRSMRSMHSGRTVETYTGTGTGTFDLHTMLTLHEFPLPPNKLVGVSTPSATQASSPNTPSTVDGSSQVTYSNHEEVLQDEYIAQLLVAKPPEPSAVQSLERSRLPSASGTRRPTKRSSAAPPNRSLRNGVSMVSESGSGISNMDPQNSGSDSPLSKTSFQASKTQSSSDRSRRTTIIRMDSGGPNSPAPGSPAATSVVGFARASYIPKNAAAAPPPPIIIPSAYNSSNLIDLSSPAHHPPRSPSRVVVSPRATHFPTMEPSLPPVHEGLAPNTPQPSRFRVSETPRPVSPLPTPLARPRDEAPPNVPEDVLSPEDPGPSTTSYLNHSNTMHRRRFSISSLMSRVSGKSSTHASTIPKGRYIWSPRTRSDAPPVPGMTTDPSQMENREANLPLPALVSRAGYLSNMMDNGRLPARNSASTYGFGTPFVSQSAQHHDNVTQGDLQHPLDNQPNSVPSRTPWEYSSGDGYVDDAAVRNRRSQSLRSFFTRNTTTDRSGHYNVMDEDMQRRYHEELAASACASSGRLGSDIVHVSIPPRSPGLSEPRSPMPSEKSGFTHRLSTDPLSANALSRSRYWQPWWRRTLLAPWRWKKRTAFAVALNATILFTVLGVLIGLATSGHLKSTASSAFGTGMSCSGNLTGQSCNLDGTCQCSTPGSVCNPVAVAILNLIPSTNSLLKTNYTATSVAKTLWDMLGTPLSGDCAQQALLVDIKTQNADDAHAHWAKAAVLYTSLQSEDLTAAQTLRMFVDKLDFSGASGSSPVFQQESSGFIFDFSAMTITPPPLTWRSDASPSQAEVSLVPASFETVLDRFTTLASARSNQTSTALMNFWTKDLSMPASQLPSFISTFQTAPILLPFDMSLEANQASLATIMQMHPPKTISFPPPLACNPMMDEQQLTSMNELEQTVFGLPAIPNVPATFDTNCFGTRPVYGVLDVLGLRLPFTDDLKAAPLQAAVLTADAASRALITVGAALSSYPSTPGAPLPPSSLTPSRYGTMDHLNHIALSFLRTIPPAQAKQVAAFICGTSSTAMTLATVDTIPTVEVSFFGPIGPNDIAYSVSSLSTPSGSLFFGSQPGNIFRQWAENVANSTSQTVVWAQSSVAAQVIRQKPGNDTTFDEVWNGAATMISNAESLGKMTTASDVDTVVGVFDNLGYFAT